MKKLLLLLLPTFLFSCIWIDGTTIDGKYKLSGNPFTSILRSTIKNSSPQTKLERILKYTTINTDNPTAENREDNAVILLLKGEYEASIKELLLLNKEYPNKYSLASNLGTVYELNGENEKALKWIKEGIKRDPQSHYGTEWLHQYILELKIEQQKSSNFLKKKRAIFLPETFSLQDKIKIGNHSYTITEISTALRYQLNERTIFVKPKEPIVADLLYTKALIEARLSTLEEALTYLDLAKLYGFSNPALLEKKKILYQNTLDNHSLSYYIDSLSNPITKMNIIVAIIFFVIFLLLYILLKKIILYIYKNKK